MKPFGINPKKRSALAAGFWLASLFFVCGSMVNFARQGETVSAQEVRQERNYGIEEEHESNGPGGSAGAPMRGASPLQIGLAVCLMLGTAGWFTLASGNRRQ